MSLTAEEVAALPVGAEISIMHSEGWREFTRMDAGFTRLGSPPLPMHYFLSLAEQGLVHNRDTRPPEVGDWFQHDHSTEYWDRIIKTDGEYVHVVRYSNTGCEGIMRNRPSLYDNSWTRRNPPAEYTGLLFNSMLRLMVEASGQRDTANEGLREAQATIAHLHTFDKESFVAQMHEAIAASIDPAALDRVMDYHGMSRERPVISEVEVDAIIPVERLRIRGFEGQVGAATTTLRFDLPSESAACPCDDVARATIQGCLPPETRIREARLKCRHHPNRWVFVY